MAFSQRRRRTAILLSLLAVAAIYYLQTIGDLPHLTAGEVGSFPKATSLLDLDLAATLDPPTHYTTRKEDYPVNGTLASLPTGKPVKIPRIQAARPQESRDEKAERLRRQAKVQESFEHSWAAYRKYAWLRDEVTPISLDYKDTFGGWAATLVDALDTLWIMDMKDDFEIAVQAAAGIDFTTSRHTQINVFETTIRYLGGFLAAYDISEARYPILLKKAKEVGDFIMGCFDTPNRMPITRWTWMDYARGSPQSASPFMIVSELGSLSLEFTRLSQLTGDMRYYDAVQRISDVFEKYQNETKLPGMWPVMVDAKTPAFSSDSRFHVGGMSDSLYEYLPKQYMMLGGLLEQSRIMYEKFMVVAREHLLFRPYNPENLDILVAGNLQVQGTQIIANPQSEHLTCFVGGMIAQAGKIFDVPDDVKIGAKLAEGCVWQYDSQATGIGPEISYMIACENKTSCIWNDEVWHNRLVGKPTTAGTTDADIGQWHTDVRDAIKLRHLAPGFISYQDRRYLLRPEAIESVFMLYRITGERKYQDMAWRMFKAVEKWTRTPHASSAISDVTIAGDTEDTRPTQKDEMESFWLAETLKYFWLCFADWDVVNLDVYVLNTEAHPLKRPKAG